MKLALFFAKRYLFSKKSVNAINIISIISVVGVMVSSAALVIVLSFYNGMEKFILSLYSTFAPELRIEPSQGKVFSTETEVFKSLRKDPSIISYSEILEDKVVLQYNNQQFIAQLKGVEPKSLALHEGNGMLYAGDFNIDSNNSSYAILGAQVQSNLRVPLEGMDNTIQLFSPRKGGTIGSVNPMDDINIRNISPRGILNFQQGFDNIIITPIAFAKDLLNEHSKVSAVEIYTKDSININPLQTKIQESLGSAYLVKNREQQNPMLYKTVRSEKWIVFFILTLIGIIAIFNIIGSLTMLVIDKKQDMSVLRSLGAEQSLIQRIFFYEGLLIASIGSVFGILIGLVFGLFQEKFGFIRTGEGANALIDAYPIDIRATDFVLVFVTIMIMATVVSYFSAKLTVREIPSNAVSPD